MIPGRSGPELAEMLMQMENFINMHPELGQSYAQPRNIKFKPDPDVIPAEEHPELQPYRNLCVDRLKLVGEGKWQMSDFLSGPLWLPFQEPRFLLHGDDIDIASGPCFKQESREENLRLAKLWDARGLLELAAAPLHENMFSRVFNAYKSAALDRQIGDRRLPNMLERSIDGPSKHLPPGFLLTNLSLAPFTEQIFGSVTDRRDFYHQTAVTYERACSNMLPFKFSEEELAGLEAYRRYSERLQSCRKKKKDRASQGDGFGFSSPTAPDLLGDGLFPCFASLFQGDHLGVEFALQGHEELLQRHGLLADQNRLKGHATFPIASQWEGLIIDDYFVICRDVFGADPLNTFAGKALGWARKAYEAHGVIGSVEKDVEGATRFKAAGAEIDSSDVLVKRGLTTVAAPLSKRLALSCLSLRIAALPVVTSKLLSRLAGNWTSVLLYRRCLTAVVDTLFKEAAGVEVNGENAVFGLSRTTATELCILSAMMPLAVSNIATRYSQKLYTSDASLGMGAVASTSIPSQLAEVLWLGSDKRGCYTRLDSQPVSLLNAAGVETHELGGESDGVEFRPQKSPLLYFDFVEFYGGSGRVSACMQQLGHSVAPPLDLSASRHFDFTDARLLEWCMHMIEQRRFKSFLSEPPCTTFSPAAHPAVRSYKQPEGFDMQCPKTWTGNLLANRSFVLLRHGRKHGAPCGKEQPHLSKMAWLPAWSQLLDMDFLESVIASCQFGSPHRKQFRFITYLLDSEGLEVRCPGGHEHVRVEGAYTKDSAVYVWGLARHLAKHFSAALARVRAAENDCTSVEGHESLILNDLLASSSWKVEKCWSWKRKSHINVLEGHGGLAVLADAALKCPDSRFCCLLDSRAAKGALAKGRSSSVSLQRVCKRSAAYQLGFGLYPGWGFAPTRLNVADDPTRRTALRQPVKHSILDFMDFRNVQQAHARSLARWSTNWVRLALLLLFLQVEGASGLDLDLHHSYPETNLDLLKSVSQSLSISHHGDQLGLSTCFGFCPSHFGALNFWSCPSFGCLRVSCGFPHCLVNLGASLSLGLLTVLHCAPWILLYCVAAWICSTSTSGLSFQPKPFKTHCRSHVRGRRSRVSWILFVCLGFPGVRAMEPVSAAERARASERGGAILVPTRVARQKTLDSRRLLLNDFRAWLYNQHGVMLQQLLTAKPPDAEEVSKWLVAYGQEMYAAGKAYGKYAETINSIATARPILRKSLVSAWDLAFAWLADEPYQHHPALPLSVLLAIMSTAMMWGWPLEAAIFGLTWAGILRIGEVLMADRSDLVLPGDSAPGTSFALLRIKYPKTRGRAARHQAARIDPPDLVELLAAVFEKFEEKQKLWPYSAVTLRKRLNALLTSIGLATDRKGGARPFDLGSFRPGGATYLLLLTEDSEVVRRRGRWVTSKVCELYLQEVLYTTYTEKLAEAPRRKIQQLAGAFPKVLEKAICFLKGAIPTKVWFRLYQANDREELGKERETWGEKHPAFATKTSGAGAGNLCSAVKKGRHADCLTTSYPMTDLFNLKLSQPCTEDPP